ncbi:MAG: GH3 auxin-responsive promoter family protein [Planctomycetota bacterium]
MWGSIFCPLLRGVAGLRRAGLERCAGDLRRRQERLLLRKVSRNADSDFGRDHCFHEIRSVEDFRRNVPLSTYEYALPYILRVLDGESGALYGPGERLRFVASTSGTTSRAKYIPITNTFVREYQHSWWIWASCACGDHAGAFQRQILQIPGSLHEEMPRAGVPCGSATGLIASMQPGFIRRLYVFPEAGSLITSGAAKYYAAMRFAATRDISIFLAANPGTIVHIARVAAEDHERLVRDVRDGTITFPDEPPETVARELGRSLRPDPAGAKRLEEIRRRTGRLLPLDLWPGLGLIACWKGGPLQNWLAQFPAYFGDTPVRDVGLVASEGRMTIPMSSDGCAGVLDILSNFFEFVPLEEAGSAAPRTLLAHELERDGMYLIVLTTSGGLYRYNINDVVKVAGFLRDAPELEFVNKGSGFANLVGEKLSECQVVQAVKEASAGFGAPPHTFTLAPQAVVPPFYVLFVEEEAVRGWREQDFLERVDRGLQRLNICYENERRLDQLGPMRMRKLSNGTWDRYCAARIERNRGRVEQYKHTYLEADFDFVGKLEGMLAADGSNIAVSAPDEER